MSVRLAYPPQQKPKAKASSKMTKIAIIDYGSGNLHSVARAFSTLIGERDVFLTDDETIINQASHLVLPGVGAFEACRTRLAQKDGLMECLDHNVRQSAKPFLGICVGMQLMAQKGLEYGEHSGLGWIDGTARILEGSQKRLPHMGWNDLKVPNAHPLFSPLQGEDVYFAHSFALDDVSPKKIAAYCDYGGDFCAAIAFENMIGVQFHPEKSQKIGLRFLNDFVSWNP